MKALRGVRTTARSQYTPSAVLEFGADDWKWNSSNLERLHKGIIQVAGDLWEFNGPAVDREGYCIVEFNAPLSKSVPSSSKLITALEELPGFDDIVIDVPRQDDRWTDLRCEQQNTIMLRVFAKTAELLNTAVLEREVIPDVWVELTLNALADRFGPPERIAIGSFRSVSTDSTSRAIDAISKVASEGLQYNALWSHNDGGAVVAGKTGGRGFQVAFIGPSTTRDIIATATWLRQLCMKLVDATEPAYARLSIEPSARGVDDTYSRHQPGSRGTLLAEERLYRYVPDAYWYQLINKELAKQLTGEFASKSVSTNLVEIIFGDIAEWIPQSPWQGDIGYDRSLAEEVVPEVFTKYREVLSPLYYDYGDPYDSDSDDDCDCASGCNKDCGCDCAHDCGNEPWR